jgi:Rieske Fe-S protein
VSQRDENGEPKNIQESASEDDAQHEAAFQTAQDDARKMELGGSDPQRGFTTAVRDDDEVKVDATRRLLDRVQRDALVTRRDFLRVLTTVSGGLCVGTGAVAGGAFRRHGEGEAAPYKIASQLGPGEAVAFAYPSNDDPAIAVRLDDGTLCAYSSVCTHLGCGVIWREDDEELFCPCHEGKFDPRSGEPTAGPPKRALPRVVLEERNDGIWATGTKA